MHDKRYVYSDGNKIKRFCLFSLGSGYNGSNEKRRKPMQMSSMTYMLEDGDIIEDLKIINKNKAFSVSSCLLTTKKILNQYVYFQLFSRCRKSTLKAAQVQLVVLHLATIETLESKKENCFMRNDGTNDFT